MASTLNTTWFTNVTYACNTGYEWARGATSYSIMCQNTGYWTKTNIPDCTSKSVAMLSVFMTYNFLINTYLGMSTSLMSVCPPVSCSQAM